MNLANWMPLNDLDRLLNHMHPMSMRLDDDFAGMRLLKSDLNWRPAASISETKGEYLIKADLPEVDKKDIHIEITDDMITLRGERKFQKTSEEEKQHRVESFYGRFERSFSIPGDVEDKNIRAECANGVLIIHLPKHVDAQAAVKSRKVAVD